MTTSWLLACGKMTDVVSSAQTEYFMGHNLTSSEPLLIYDTLPFLQPPRKSAKRFWLFSLRGPGGWTDRRIFFWQSHTALCCSPATLIFLINLQSPASFPGLCADFFPPERHVIRGCALPVEGVCVRAVTHSDCLTRPAPGGGRLCLN